MAFFKVQFVQAGGKTQVDKKSLFIVEADDVATARGIVDSLSEADSSWADVTPVDVTSLSASDFTGFRYRVKVSGAAAGDPDLVSAEYTGVASDALDDVGDGLVLALNAAYGAAMAAAIADDGGAFTDETAEANEATADDMTLLPASATQDDAYYFGAVSPFTVLSLNVSQVGTGTYTLTWEYWDGSTWSSLSGLTDNTGDYKNSGLATVVFTRPTDWDTTSINSQGPLYFIRAVVDAGTVTQQPLGQQATTQAATASYVAGSNTLTVTDAAAVYGDRTLQVDAFPPGAEASVSQLIGTVTDEGSASAATTVVLDEQTAIPSIIAEA